MNTSFERNILKKCPKGNHWGDLRARLELAVDKMLDIHHENHSNDSDYTSDSDDSPTKLLSNERMTSAVRKDFCSALRDLLQHGLIGNASDVINEGSAHSVFNWGCFSSRSHLVPRQLHAWDVVVKYYELKVHLNIINDKTFHSNRLSNRMAVNSILVRPDGFPSLSTYK